MSVYLWINIGILILPFLFSFERRVQYHRKWPAVFTSILIVSPVYIIWDIMATARGDWGFNEEFVAGIRFGGLPLEEILFFITVPYSCLFIYAVLKSYVQDRLIALNPLVFRGLTILSFVLAGVFHHQSYTSTNFVFLGIFFLLAGFVGQNLVRTRLYWIYVGLTYIPFIIFNYLLTSLPVVRYGQSAIWGNRFLTIPWEDFIYSFAMVSFYIGIYWFYFERKAYSSGSTS